MLNVYGNGKLKKFLLDISPLSHNMVFLLVPSRSIQLLLEHSFYLFVPKTSSQPVCWFWMAVRQPPLFKLQLASFSPRLSHHRRKALKKGLYLVHHGTYPEAPTTSPHEKVFHNNRFQIDVCPMHMLTPILLSRGKKVCCLTAKVLIRVLPLTNWPATRLSFFLCEIKIIKVPLFQVYCESVFG